MVDEKQEARSLAVSLPNSRAELMALRKVFKNRLLNDLVEEVFVTLFDREAHPEYVKLLEAVWDAETVEGSCKADDLEAARYMRVYAAEQGIAVIPEKNLETLSRATNVVLRRYSLTRRLRRGSVGGEQLDLGIGKDG